MTTTTVTDTYTVRIYTEHAFRNNYRATTVIRNVGPLVATAIALRNKWVRIEREMIETGGFRTRLVGVEIMSRGDGKPNRTSDDTGNLIALVGDEWDMFLSIATGTVQPRNFWSMSRLATGNIARTARLLATV